MSDWKDLKIDDLPPDILTGDYEFQYTGDLFKYTDAGVYAVLSACKTGHPFRYRKPEPKQPTHEEIMTTDWEIETRGDIKIYERPVQCKVSGDFVCYFIDNAWLSVEWFKNRKSADIPPEE